MDFYSTFFCLPPPTLPQSLITSASNLSLHQPNDFHTPPSDRSSISPPSSNPEQTSLPLVSRIPSQITSSQPAPTSAPPSFSTHIIPSLPQVRSNAFCPSARHAPLPAPEHVQTTCAELMSQYHCLVTATHAFDRSTYGFHLSGSFPQVMAARGRLLCEQPFEVERVVAVDRSDVLDGTANVRPFMKLRLDEIASASLAHLSIVGNGGENGGIDVIIRGTPEAVEEARVRLFVLLDQLNGLLSEVCEIDYKLHCIIAGRKRSVVQSIQEETATNIYFPSTLSGSGILGAQNPLLSAKRNMIFITGEYFGVQRAREMLFQVSIHKSKCIISRDTVMLPRKLDWLLMEKLPQLQQIMYDNGTFINFPPIGSQTSVLSVYGDHRVHIERTIRSLMRLACDFYVANVWLLPNALQEIYKNGSQPALINQSEIQPDGNRISIESGAEIVFKSTNSFEVYGTEQSVKRAIECICKLEMVKNCQIEIRFQVELACEHRDFISGKKNGKLNKIMKTSNVKIKFESFNDYNFMIDLSGNSSTALMGLNFLEEELPAEISFHIPESYHKRIIGVGGKNIQRIMKKYGVYVKFSNAEEFSKLGGYQKNHDNVVARTPAKNAENLQNLKQSVMELVHPKDKDFITETMFIDRNYHRNILGEKSIFIHDIESKTNTCFYFPSSEYGTDTVEIFGPRSQIAISKQMIMSHLGVETDYRLIYTNELVKLIRSEEFDERVVKKSKRNWNVSVVVIGGTEGEDLTIKFRLSKAHTENLKHAQDCLEGFLIENQINFQRQRTGSSQHRRNTVTSIGSMDHSTSVGTFTPTTPTDPMGFGNIHRFGSDKDLKGLLERTNNGQPSSPMSSLTNPPPSYVFHPGMALNRLYNPFTSTTGHGTVENSAGIEWNSTPRQLKNQYNYSLLGNGPNLNGLKVTTPGMTGLDHFPYGGFVNGKMGLSPRTQSLDLGKGKLGTQLMENQSAGLLNSGSGFPLTSFPPLRSSGSNVNSLHRSQFSQGSISHHTGNLVNGFNGLNLGI
ncbi:hypothetical protein O181_023323 [Austropuccinia psidii MF-1]|uniref:K Homology domain-containing protein n=1 Tax=Austropuccinia psidii MF-1 TaxID=1389203 RepID=A0A9Q3GX67_9BASI|nr:hypothetical protein [Austropuccinia psidii MF-1]